MTDLVGVYGAGGCGRSVMTILREAHRGYGREFVFVDDATRETSVNGHRIMTWEAFLSAQNFKQICVAVANSRVREVLVKKCIAAGVDLVGAKAASALFQDDVSIPTCAIVSPFSTIGNNCEIGRSYIGDLYSCVNHDCKIGNFVTLAPYANCNGNVYVDDHVYIGAGAIVRQGEAGKPLKIGHGAVIGMGAVVTRDVAAGVTVVGNPARPLVRV